MIGHMVCSFFGTIAFSILFNVPRRFYLSCGLTGMLGWLCYCLVSPYTGATVASFLGTIVVVLMSRILAVYQKCPITVFLISGIFPLVPGAKVYYTAYYFVTNSLSLATRSGIESIKIAFAIVMGIVFMVSVPKRWFQIAFWKEKFGMQVIKSKKEQDNEK